MNLNTFTNQLKRNSLSLVLLSLLSLSLSGCGGGDCPSDNRNLSPLKVDLQLDYVGTVPVLNGGATSSYFYIHNDESSPISGINYTLAGAATEASLKQSITKKDIRVNGRKLSSSDVIDKNGFILDGASLASCGSIPAHGSCRIHFTTPSLSVGNQNNSLFKVSVRDRNGFIHNYDQVINYVDYNVNLNNGVNFATSADVVANLTDKRYMMGYLVAGGAPGSIYNHVNLELSNGNSISVRDGFVNGQSMASGELIPVNFNVRILSTLPNPENITPQYSQDLSNRSLKATGGQGQSLYLNTCSQTQSELALKLGVIPILSAPTTESNAPTIYVSNFGESLSGFTIEPVNSEVRLYDNNCTSKIESNGSCRFKLGVDSLSSGVSDILFKVNGETVFTKAVYYNASGIPSLVSNFGAGEVGLNPNQTSSIINYTFTNLGDVDLHSLVFNPTISGSSGFKIINNGCGITISVGSQCIIQVQLIGSSSAERGTAYLDITAKYGSGAEEQDFSSQSGVINYYITDAAVSDKLVITSPVGSESSLSILGDGVEATSTTFVINNPSNNSISIESIGLTGVNVNTSGLLITDNNCGSSLGADNTCQVTVTYGPLSPESNNSGVANLQINYGTGNIITGTINYSVLALDSYLKITNVVAGVGFTGDGTSTVPYAGSGCNNNPMTIAITYKNMSTNFEAKNLALNLINGHVPAYYAVDTTQTTCGYGANPKDLGIGSSCDLVLVADRSVMKYNNSFNLNIIYPLASWDTTQGFIKQDGFTYAGSTSLYVNYTQPVLVSTLTPVSGSTSEMRTLTQTLVGGNAVGCGSFKTKISDFAYESEALIQSGSCTVGNDGSAECTNNSANPTNIINYTIQNEAPNQDVFLQFNLDTSGAQIWYNPSILMFKIGGLTIPTGN